MATKPIPSFYRNARNMTARECRIVREGTYGRCPVLMPTRSWIIYRNDAGQTIVGQPVNTRTSQGHDTYRVTDLLS